jgi:hypothetical protein
MRRSKNHLIWQRINQDKIHTGIKVLSRRYRKRLSIYINLRIAYIINAKMLHSMNKLVSVAKIIRD